jgi:hypothetical protein
MKKGEGPVIVRSVYLSRDPRTGYAIVWAGKPFLSRDELSRDSDLVWDSSHNSLVAGDAVKRMFGSYLGVRKGRCKRLRLNMRITQQSAK